MFQFRPFPSYAYLIQRTITEYCSVGFPHSEIHGYNGYLLLPVAYRSLSRPSSAPDAKAFPLRSFQLDRRRVKLRSLRFRLAAKTAYRFVAPPLPREPACAGLRSDGDGVTALCASFPILSLEMFWFSKELCRQFHGRSLVYEIVTLHLLRCCSTIKTLTFCCLAYHFSSRCSVFKVRRRRGLRIARPRASVRSRSLRRASSSSQNRFRWVLLGWGLRFPVPFEARLKYSISRIFQSVFKRRRGGPEWARTTDLTIISRTL